MPRLFSQFAWALGATVLFSPGARAQPGQWQYRAPLHTARHLMTVGLLNGRIYAIGGGSPSTRANEEYDDSTNVWYVHTTSPIPTETRGSVVNGSLLLAGGNVNGTCSHSAWVYFPCSYEWALSPPSLPTQRCQASAATVNGLWYVIGGTNTVSGAPVANVDVFNYNTIPWSWTVAAPMPTARQGADAAVVDGLIYVVGGSAGGSALATVESYDPTTNTWTTRAPLSTPRAAAAVCELNGRLYAVGGQDQSGSAIASVEVYTPSTNTWSPRASMHDPREFAGAISLHGLVYAIGGRNQTGELSSVEVFSETTIPCRTDFNGDGHLGIQDLFDYIRAWFSGCP